MKLNVRDLVNAGAFSLLTVMAIWVGGMIGFIPVAMPFVPFACGLLSGPVFILYSTKIHRFGMILVMGVVCGLVFSLGGHGAVALPLIIAVSLLSEWVMKKGGYNSPKQARRAYTVFMLFAAANLLPLYFARDQYIQSLIEGGYGADFANKLAAVMPSWSFVPVVLLGMLGGYLGCTIGLKLINKHARAVDTAK